MEHLKMFDLSGQTAVITGAASGLGKAAAEVLADAGAKVVLGDINLDGAQNLAQALQARGKQAHAVQCDVSNEKQVAALIAEAVQQFGAVDIMVNNAGIGDPTPRPVHESTTADWNTVVGVNLNGVYFGCREALKVMVPRGKGKIINVASMWGLFGASSIAPLPAYNATKGAVVNLTRELGLEYAPLGINVNALCPGFFHTSISNNAYEDKPTYDSYVALTPMGRVAQPDEIKGTVLYLASSASSFLTGSMIVIDGGVTAK